MTARLSVAGLVKSYNGMPILSGVDLEIRKGETVAVIGRSGAGKSTLLKCLTLLDIPDGGSLILDGQAYFNSMGVRYDPWEVRRNIGLVFQDFKLFPNMTARQNIVFALRKTKEIALVDANDRAEEVASELGILDALDKYPAELSGGEAQRCALARAMVLEPKVLLLDEITSALDPATIVDVTTALRRLRKADSSGEMVVILVTHLMHFAETFADRIAFLGNGVILEDLPAAEFFRSTTCSDV